MNKRAFEKEIDVLVEKRSNLTTALLLLLGGDIGLMLNLTSKTRFLLFIIGVILIIPVINSLLSIEGRLITLLKELSKDEL